MTTTSTGFLLLLAGALLWLGTRWAGVTWGRKHPCWIGIGVRVTCGLVLYGAAVSIGMRGVEMTSAQTFSPDSQLVGTARRGLSVDDRHDLADLRELVKNFIDEQHTTNANAAAARHAIERRLDQIEEARPAETASTVKGMQRRDDERAADYRDLLKLLIPIIGAIAVGFILDWWKRKKGQES